VTVVNVDNSYHRQYREQTTTSVASQPTINRWFTKYKNFLLQQRFNPGIELAFLHATAALEGIMEPKW